MIEIVAPTMTHGRVRLSNPRGRYDETMTLEAR
jgi:hypothetical protein